MSTGRKLDKTDKLIARKRLEKTAKKLGKNLGKKLGKK